MTRIALKQDIQLNSSVGQVTLSDWGNPRENVQFLTDSIYSCIRQQFICTFISFYLSPPLLLKKKARKNIQKASTYIQITKNTF